MPAKNPEMYFSFDVEADGRYPSRYSMLSIGMVACATFDGSNFVRLNIDSKVNQFYDTMRPITDQHTPAAVKVCREGGLDRGELLISGLEPFSVMPRLASWVLNACRGSRPVAVCYPAWDWQWLYDYLERFSPKNPFGFSGMIDMKSWYCGRNKALLINSTKRNMPKKIRSSRAHTHNALDDAIEQAEMFCNMWELL